MKIEIDDTFIKWAKSQDADFFESCSKLEEKEHLEELVNDVLYTYMESRGDSAEEFRREEDY